MAYGMYVCWGKHIQGSGMVYDTGTWYIWCVCVIGGNTFQEIRNMVHGTWHMKVYTIPGTVYTVTCVLGETLSRGVKPHRATW